MSTVEDKASLVPLRMKVVSSAYWLILISVLLTQMPLTFLLDLMALAKISADSIKRYGEEDSLA